MNRRRYADGSERIADEIAITADTSPNRKTAGRCGSGAVALAVAERAAGRHCGRGVDAVAYLSGPPLRCEPDRFLIVPLCARRGGSGRLVDDSQDSRATGHSRFLQVRKMLKYGSSVKPLLCLRWLSPAIPAIPTGVRRPYDRRTNVCISPLRPFYFQRTAIWAFTSTHISGIVIFVGKRSGRG